MESLEQWSMAEEEGLGLLTFWDLPMSMTEGGRGGTWTLRLPSDSCFSLFPAFAIASIR